MMSKLHNLNGAVLESIEQLHNHQQSVTGMVLMDLFDVGIVEPTFQHQLAGMVLIQDPMPVQNRLPQLHGMVLYNGYGPAKPPKQFSLQGMVVQDMFPKEPLPPTDAYLQTRIY